MGIFPSLNVIEDSIQNENSTNFCISSFLHPTSFLLLSLSSLLRPTASLLFSPLVLFSPTLVPLFSNFISSFPPLYFPSPLSLHSSLPLSFLTFYRYFCFLSFLFLSSLRSLSFPLPYLFFPFSLLPLPTILCPYFHSLLSTLFFSPYSVSSLTFSPLFSPLFSLPSLLHLPVSLPSLTSPPFYLNLLPVF